MVKVEHHAKRGAAGDQDGTSSETISPGGQRLGRGWWSGAFEVVWCVRQDKSLIPIRESDVVDAKAPYSAFLKQILLI